MTRAVEQNWRRQWARDFLAVGSWVFYILIIGRAMIVPYRPFTDQLLIAAALLLILGAIYRRFDWYIARGLVLAVTVIVFYESRIFAAFIVVAAIGLTASARYLGSAWREIAIGLAAGAVIAAVTYPIATFTRKRVLPELGRVPAHVDPDAAGEMPAGDAGDTVPVFE